MSGTEHEHRGASRRVTAWTVGSRAVALVVVSALGGCSSDPPPPDPFACVENLSTDCAPLYDPPDYSTIFSKILQPTCAAGMGTCHTSDAQMGGLVFEDADDAYARLLGDVGRARVIPGDPACSLLVIRLESHDPNVRMPPGPTPLLESERCTVIRWIADGALR